MTGGEFVQDDPPWFRDALSDKAVRHTVTADGCQIVCRQWGDADDPPIVLVHGYGAHSHWWDHIGPLLADGHSVWAPDLSGHGDSGWRADYGTDVWAADLEAVLAAFCTQGVLPIVVAHSMGGRIACVTGARVGASWGGLLLLDSTLGRLESGRVSAVAPRAVRGSVFDSAEEAVNRYRLRPPQSDVLPYVLRHVAEQSVRQTERGWEWKTDANTAAVAVAPVSAGALRKIDCRIALLQAEFGAVAPDMGEWMSLAVGRAVATLKIPLAHHHVMFDQPIALVTAVRAVVELWSNTAPLPPG